MMIARWWVRPWMVSAIGWGLFPIWMARNLRHAWLWSCEDARGFGADIDFPNLTKEGRNDYDDI